MKRGLWAEELTCRYLQKKGYRILKRNYRSLYGEIDIIALDGDELVFVEVRFRKEGSLVKAEESLTPAKVSKIRKTAQIFLQDYEGDYRLVRFDFVAISQKGIRHYQNAF